MIYIYFFYTSYKVKKKMSFERLMSEVSENRKLFVWKVYNEMSDNASVNTPDRKSGKAYFLQLVEENKELSEIEKRYCSERKIYDFELWNALYKWGEPKECDKCKTTRYSDKFCEKCIILHLQSLFDTWTSGNEIINDFIRQCQTLSFLPLEWIPFDQFEDVKYLTKGGFSSIYYATWTRGCICDYDENKNEFIHNGSQKVVLKSLNNSSNPGKAFFNEVII